jgi:hypothetical protein
MAQGMTCDRCGKPLLVEEDVRYEVAIVVRCAYDPLEITDEDLDRDLDAELQKTLKALDGLSEEEAMDQVYRRFRFDLCPPCRRAYVRNPLGRPSA